MPLINDVIRRKKRIKKRRLNDIVVETSAVMKDIFESKNASIDDLVLATFAMGRLYSEAFRAKCCPKGASDMGMALDVYKYVSGMLGECGGALHQELIGKHGPAAEKLSQELVEAAMGDKITEREASRILFDKINKIREGEDEYSG